MSELAEIRQRVAGIFEAMDLEVPSEETDLFELGVLDSMTFVQLMVQLEEQLGISVSVNQLEPENFRSIHNIALFVLSKQHFRKRLARGASS